MLRLVKTDRCVECGVDIFGTAQTLHCKACSFDENMAKKRKLQLSQWLSTNPTEHKLQLTRTMCSRCGRDLKLSEVDTCLTCTLVLRTAD